MLKVMTLIVLSLVLCSGTHNLRAVAAEVSDQSPLAVIQRLHRARPGEWEVRFLSAATRIDPNGLAHVWARYVFLYKGATDHCGYESYGLFKTPEGWKVISFADT